MRTLSVLPLLVALLAGVTPITGCAQDGGGLAAAEAAVQRGQYEEARQQLRTLLAAGADTTGRATVRYVETFLATGAYDEGLQDVAARLARTPDDPFLLHMKGRLLVQVGRYADAEQAFRQSGQRKPDYARTALELADLLTATGRGPQARRLYEAIYQQYRRGAYTTADEVSVAARAAAALEQFHDANEAFRTAYQLDAADVQTLYWWAELFRTKYNDADAQRTYEEALALNPHYAALYVGLARSVNSFAQKEELAQKALEANPNSVDAVGLLAGLRILDGQYDEAEALVRQALAVNPSALEVLAHLAAIHHLRGEPDALEAVAQQALTVNPRGAEFFVTIADDLALRFRYPAAVTFSQRAVETDPGNPRALASLGTSLLRLGESQQARRYLDRAFQRDPFNLFVGNTLTLLDEYQDFALLESAHFRLLIHNDERDVLGPAVLDEAEASYAALSDRYPYTPAGKILLEAYNDRDDFAVRVAGVPHLGLLGVSFGDVVAFNTPRAQAGNTYNWARTLWHELAHTMAIGVSQFHVPRWFTEGLSVYEEQRARPEWGREMDLELFSAFDRDRLHPLADIDRGFTRPAFPGQVLLSYYHASKVIAFLVDTYGFDAVTGILSALGEGQTMEEAVQHVLGQSRDALDDAFRADLRRRRDAFDEILSGMPDLLGEAPEGSLLDRLTGRAENPFLERLQEGYAALEQEDYGTAETRFRQALEIYPDFIAAGNPYEGLAAVYRARGERDQLVAVLERFLSVSEYGPAEARELGGLYEEDGDLDAAVRALRRSLDVEPYDLPTREQLAALYTRQGRHDLAVRERRAALALNPVDKARAYYDLARSLYDTGDCDQTKRAVLQSLELAPGYRDAQKLLLACVDDAP